ncbi:MAG TPA: thioredoxin domain-containing protein [Candidatus Methylomirabilis sp.]|nr:thioredoxin domain-containing protein [Candidatus Methylomirabilis sp.]
MKISFSAAAVLGMSLLFPPAQAQRAESGSPAASSVPPSEIQKTVEAYLRHVYAFGPETKLSFSPLKETGVSGLLETTVELKIEDSQQTATLFVSKDGKYLLRGELSDLTKDPLAEARAKLQTQDAPVLGDPKAPVKLVEFSDFECPVCRNLHDVLRGLLPNYPQVQVIFKDFPLEQLHPWARTAALAGRCAFQQDPKGFWKLYDLIYDGQDLISAENAWTKMNDFAGQVGLDPERFKSCLASPEAAGAVNASRANGQQLEVSSTPTMFVNGRRIVGVDSHVIEQYIQYEIAHRKPTDKRQ